MSTSTEKSATAAPVTSSLSLTSSTPEYDVKCTLKVFENLGRVSISWNLPSPYILSGFQNSDGKLGMSLLLLAHRNTRVEKKFVERTGTWDTDEVWGTGWSAAILGLDCSDKSIRCQMQTPETQEKP